MADAPATANPENAATTAASDNFLNIDALLRIGR
jgi:hypothetical protein